MAEAIKLLDPSDVMAQVYGQIAWDGHIFSLEKFFGIKEWSGNDRGIEIDEREAVFGDWIIKTEDNKFIVCKEKSIE